MKKRLLSLFILVIMLFTCAIASAEVVGVTAEATMETPYHQVTRLFIEYSEEIAAPEIDAYQVFDFATANLKEDYECRPYDVGVITAVYTNSEPAVLESKESVPGKYVVIELAGTDGSYFDEAEQLWKPKNITGIATWREAGKSSQYVRTDWSLFTVVQTADIVNAEGAVVAKKGILPALADEAVPTPEVDAAFTQMSIPASNGTHDINFNLHLPENYDPSKTYPVIFCQPGGGGLNNYQQQDENGNFSCLGADITLDAVAISFVRSSKDLIVVAAQGWKNPPEEWNVDTPGDYVELIDYILANYAVDRERVYALGSSNGTFITSLTIQRRPDLFKGYVMCNGAWITTEDSGRWYGGTEFLVTNAEISKTYNGYKKEQIMEMALNPENWKPAEEIKRVGKALECVVENRIPVYVFDGTNTQNGSIMNSPSVYIYLKNRYLEEGLSSEEIDQILKIYLADDDEYHPLGVCEYHAASKIAVTESFDVIDWILSK